MTICSNPKQRRIRIPVGEDSVILSVRNYTDQEYSRFMGSRHEFKRRGKIKDNSMEARIKFMDSILTDIAAEMADGMADVVTYIDPATGKEEPLTPEVDNWKSYVNPAWKIAAALMLEGDTAEMEAATVKN